MQENYFFVNKISTYYLLLTFTSLILFLIQFAIIKFWIKFPTASEKQFYHSRCYWNVVAVTLQKLFCHAVYIIHFKQC